MNIREKVYSFVKSIPKGKVSTYKVVAINCNVSNPRTIGFYLHNNHDPKNIPCHRVVNFRGEVAENFAFGGGDAQKKLLESEGITFVDGKINLEKYLWKN